MVTRCSELLRGVLLASRPAAAVQSLQLHSVRVARQAWQAPCRYGSQRMQMQAPAAGRLLPACRFQPPGLACVLNSGVGLNSGGQIAAQAQAGQHMSSLVSFSATQQVLTCSPPQKVRR